MEFSYIIEESDFIQFNLYVLKNSDTFESNIKKRKLFLIVLICIASIYVISSKEYNLLFLSSALIVSILFFYNNFYKWKMKLYFKKYVKKIHKIQLNKSETLTFEKKEIFIQNQLGKGKINKSEILTISEIKDLIMLHLKNGSSIVIPKKNFNQVSVLKNELKNIEWKSNLTWKF